MTFAALELLILSAAFLAAQTQCWDWPWPLSGFLLVTTEWPQVWLELRTHPSGHAKESRGAESPSEELCSKFPALEPHFLENEASGGVSSGHKKCL